MPTVLDLFCCQGGASEGYRRCGMNVIGADNNAKHIKIYAGHFGAGHCLSWEEGLHRFGAFADLIHASPPCQGFSTQTRNKNAKDENGEPKYTYLNLIPEVREALLELGKPYVIENVPEARDELRNPVMLSARMFNGELWANWDVRDTAADYYEKILSETELVDGQRLWIKRKPRHTAYLNSPIPEEQVPTRWTIERKRLFEVHGFELEPLPIVPTTRTIMSITQSVNPTQVWNKVNRQSVPLSVRQEIMGGLGWMTTAGIGESLPPAYTEHIGYAFLGR